jgi:hypothetical protein
MIIAAVNTPEGYVFTGHFAGGSDYYTFLTKMKWGYDGHWLYENRYTPEPTQRVPIYFFYLFLGHAARILGLTLPAMFLLTDFVLAAIAFMLMLRLLKDDSIHSLIFAVFAFPNIDITARFAAKLFSMPERFFYLYPSAMSFFMFPHYIIDFIGFILVLGGAKDGINRNGIIKGISGTYLLLIIHPFLLASAYLIPLLYTVLFDRNRIKTVLLYEIIIGLAGSPYLLILYKDFTTVPWLIAWRQQATAKSSVIGILLSYGFPFATAVIYVIYLIVKEKTKTAGIWIAWLIAELALVIFMPLTNKNEFMFALSVPVGILASRCIERINRIKPRVLSYILSIAMVSFNLMFALFPTVTVINSKQHKDSIYLPTEYVAGLETMANESSDSVVLCRSDTGNLIPYYSGIRPFVGHISETINYKQKKAQADDLFSGKLTEQEIAEIIKEYNIRYVVVDKYLYNDRTLVCEGLSPVFANKHIEIYKTSLPDA